MRIIQWNIYNKTFDIKKAEFIKSVIKDEETIVCLLGVRLEDKTFISNAFKDYLISYSLDKKMVLTFSSPLRQFGVLFILSPSFKLISESTYPGAILDERTYILEAKYNERIYKLLGFFGFQDDKREEIKSIENLAFAELISILKPSISFFSITEPKVDSLDINKLIFNDNFDKGLGGRTVFQELKKARNVDSFLEINTRLPFSFIKQNKKLRHDYIYTKYLDVRIKESYYLYKEAIENDSEHALIVTFCKLI